MFMRIIVLICATRIGDECLSVKLVDLPSDSDDPDPPQEPLDIFNDMSIIPTRRASRPIMNAVPNHPPIDDETGDRYLKGKIALIIKQTMQSVNRKLTSVQKIKEAIKDDKSYKVGFLISMITKTRGMLGDLFNLAVKHRDHWKALQQMKVFEYIVHTNVDAANLVRQLVEVHLSEQKAIPRLERALGANVT